MDWYFDKATIGEEHPEYAILLNNLATLLQETGKPEDARETFAKAVEIGEKALGKDHPLQMQRVQNYARLLREYFPEDPALAELEATFGPDIGK